MRTLTLTAGDMRLEWHCADDGASERVMVRQSTEWIEVARSDPARSGVQSLVFAVAPTGQTEEIPVLAASWEADSERVTLHGHAGNVPVCVTWLAADGYIRAHARATFHEHVALESVRSRYLYMGSC